jgi:hypothetical protein
MNGSMMELEENIRHAVQVRLQKQRHTDFYARLCLLTERISIYKHMFKGRQPRYLSRRTNIESHSSKQSVSKKQRGKYSKYSSLPPQGSGKYSTFKMNRKASEFNLDSPDVSNGNSPMGVKKGGSLPIKSEAKSALNLPSTFIK